MTVGLFQTEDSKVNQDSEASFCSFPFVNPVELSGFRFQLFSISDISLAVRLLLEILIIGALIYVGWEIPFRDRLPTSVSGVAKSRSPAAAAPQPINTGAAPRQPFVRAASTPSGAWMWDPNRRSALDRPTPSHHP